MSKTTLPEHMSLDKRERKQLMSLAPRLEQAGYNERDLTELLDIGEFYQLREGFSARTLFRAGQDSPLAHLGSFWFLNQTRERGLLEQLMGAETLAVLQKLGLIKESPQGVKACAHLFPLLGRYIFTDLISHAGDPMYQVYWLGSDSVALARCAPRVPLARSLDLCTGSGVHAVLAGAHASQAWGVDINPRALEISRINAILNGLDSTCRFVLGSLYDPVPEGQFGLITANPPFVPTPRGDLALFRPGGETGEDITEAIVRGLTERLEVGGTMALVSQVPVIRGSHVLDRVEKWLGGSQGWGLAYLMLGPLDRDDMIAGHVTTLDQFTAKLGLQEGTKAYRREFETWLDSYEANGIEGVELAMTYVRRLEPGRPGWRAVWPTGSPKDSVSGWVQSWLDAQERFSARPMDWQWQPAWTPGCLQMMVDARNGEGFVFRKPAFCLVDAYLPRESAFLLNQADGHKTARQLLECFAQHFERGPDQAASEVSECLAELGRQLLID